MNLIATAKTAVRSEVNPRSSNPETLLHKSITVATTSTVIVLLALLLWTARTVILLIFALGSTAGFGPIFVACGAKG